MFGLGLSCGLKQRKLAAAIGAVFTEDFESYSIAELTAQSNWSAARGSATALVHAGNIASVTVNADGLCSFAWDDVGSTYESGTISSEVVVATTGHANCQPGVMGRYVDDNNLVWAILNNGNNQLNIASMVGGVSTGANVVQVWTRGVTYYLDLIMDGTALTANVYSDAGKQTLVATVSHTSTLNVPGKVGMVNNAQSTGRGYFDNFTFTAA